jgi:hypothetical protein
VQHLMGLCAYPGRFLARAACLEHGGHVLRNGPPPDVKGLVRCIAAALAPVAPAPVLVALLARVAGVAMPADEAVEVELELQAQHLSQLLADGGAPQVDAHRGLRRSTRASSRWMVGWRLAHHWRQLFTADVPTRGSAVS